jgi:hypothetical protein
MFTTAAIIITGMEIGFTHARKAVPGLPCPKIITLEKSDSKMEAEDGAADGTMGGSTSTTNTIETAGAADDNLQSAEALAGGADGMLVLFSKHWNPALFIRADSRHS